MKFNYNGSTIEIKKISNKYFAFITFADGTQTQWELSKLTECHYKNSLGYIIDVCKKDIYVKPADINEHIPLSDKILLAVNRPLDEAEEGIKAIGKKVKRIGIILGLLGLYLYNRSK